MTHLRPCHRITYLLLLALAVTILPTVHAQEERLQEQREIRIFALKYSDVNEVLQTVQKLVGPSTSIVSESRTNSLIATSTSNKELDELEALLMRLDSEMNVADTLETRLIPLAPTLTHDAWLESTLETVGDEVKFTIDDTRRVLVVRGDRTKVDTFLEFVENLQEIERNLTQEIPDVTPVMLRVAWLLNRIETESAQPIPKQMESVAATLKRVGINDLQLVTQILVQMDNSNARFSAEGTLHLPQRIHVSIQGVRTPDGRIDLVVETEEVGERNQRGRGGETQHPVPSFDSSLQATITLQPGQLAVLGAAPCGTHDSVFVVELIE
jgi:glycine cleavage system regulatory protein